MTQQVIYLGVVPNDGLGTPLRNAGQMINSNFTELYAALPPTQTGNAGKFLSTDGTNLSWQPASGGSVTSVDASGTQGVSVTGGPITTAGSFTIGLGDITPTSVAATGTVTGSNLSGTNTGDQTLNSLLPTQTGQAGKVLGTDGTNTSWVALGGLGTVTSVDVSSSTLDSSGGPITASGVIVVDLPVTGVTPGSYTLTDITVDAYGRITSASDGTGGGGGTVTSVDLSSTNGTISISGGPVTTSGTIDIDLPVTGVTAGTYFFATLTVDDYGRITFADTATAVTSIDISTTTLDVSGGPVTSSGSILVDLPVIGVTPGSYNLANITVDAYGRVTGVGNGSAAGGPTEVQYNDSGTFASSIDFTYDETSTPTLSVGTSSGTGIIGLGGTQFTGSGSSLLIGTPLISVNGNLDFTGSSVRITGDMSNSTASLRMYFQTNVTDGASNLSVIPNGISKISGLLAEDSSTVGNNAYIGVITHPTLSFGSPGTGISSTRRGTGTTLPFQIAVGDTPLIGYYQDTLGNVVLGGETALATTATDRFISISTMPGIPTGTPTLPTGFAAGSKSALVVDSSNDKLYFYSTSAWHAPLVEDTNGDVTVSGEMTVGSLAVSDVNASGVATLVAGSATVSSTLVTAGNIIMLTVQSLGTVSVPNAMYISARTVGTDFTITSADGTDTSTVAWFIIN